MPEIDEMLTIAPRLFSRMIAAALRVPFQVPFRCTAMTWSNCSSVILRMVASRVMPALFTMMSRPPNSLDRRGDECVDLVGVGHVAANRPGDVAPPSRSAAASRRGEIEVADDHPGALGDEALAIA